MTQIAHIHGTEPITWQSEPDYDNWLWDSYWSCEDWKQYHQALEAHYGLETANNIWLRAWNEQGSFESAFNWCKYNSEIVAYLLNKGIDIRSYVSAILVPIGETAADVIDDAGEVVTDATDTIKLFSKFLPLIVIGAGVLAWQYYSPKKR